MALSLGVRAGSQVILTDHEGLAHTLTVRRINSAVDIDVAVDGQDFKLTDQERVAVIPDCFVFSGAREGRGDEEYTYLAFEAPRDIRIDRVRGGQRAVSDRKDR